jgi:hypothetical protein
MRHQLLAVYAVCLLILIVVGCSTTDYGKQSPYTPKFQRDLEVYSYTDLGNGSGNYQVFGPAGGQKQEGYKELGWRLWLEEKPRGFSSNNQDGFIMDLNNMRDDQVIVWDGLGYYKYVNDDYGYNLTWQDFRVFANYSAFQIILPTGDTTVALRFFKGQIFPISTDWHDLKASFTMDKKFAHIGEQVMLDGSGSQGRYMLPDPQTWIVKWDWYLDNQWIGAGQKYLYPVQTTVGHHVIKLIVTDNLGNTSETSIGFEVLGNNQNTKFPWESYGQLQGNDYFGYALVTVNGVTKLLMWGHKDLLHGRIDKPYFFGSFHGLSDVAWQWIFPTDDQANPGWVAGMIDLPSSGRDMNIYLGWGGYYLEGANDPFAQTNFDHMPYCFGWGCGPLLGENGVDNGTNDIYIKIRFINNAYQLQDPCK